MKKSWIYFTAALVMIAGTLSAEPPNNFMGGAQFKDNDPRLPKEGETTVPEATPKEPQKDLPTLPVEEEGINLADSNPITSPSGDDSSDYIPVLPAEDGGRGQKDYPLDNSYDNLVSVPIKETDLSLLEELNELKRKVADLEAAIEAKNNEKPSEKSPAVNPVDLKMLEDLKKKVEELEKQRQEEKDRAKSPVTTRPETDHKLPEKPDGEEHIVKNVPEEKEPEGKETSETDLPREEKTPGEKSDGENPELVNTENPSEKEESYIENTKPRTVYYLEKGDFRPAGKNGISDPLTENTPPNEKEKEKEPSFNPDPQNDTPVKSPVEDPAGKENPPVKDVPKEKEPEKEITKNQPADQPANNDKKNVGPDWQEWDKTVLRDGGNVYSQLAPGYYIQVGAYSLKKNSANKTYNNLKKKNIAAPVKILKGSDYNRVLVGTLRRDEVGRVLAKLESIGYKKTLLIWVK